MPLETASEELRRNKQYSGKHQRCGEKAGSRELRRHLEDNRVFRDEISSSARMRLTEVGIRVVC